MITRIASHFHWLFKTIHSGIYYPIIISCFTRALFGFCFLAAVEEIMSSFLWFENFAMRCTRFPEVPALAFEPMYGVAASCVFRIVMSYFLVSEPVKSVVVL